MTTQTMMFGLASKLVDNLFGGDESALGRAEIRGGSMNPVLVA